MAGKTEAPGLFSPVTSLKGVGPKKAECFSRLGIERIADVLELYPREYEDLRSKKTISQLRDGDKAVVTARIFMATLGKGFGKKRTLHVYAEDDTGRMEVLFFNGAYFLKQFSQGSLFRFFGKVKAENIRAEEVGISLQKCFAYIVAVVEEQHARQAERRGRILAVLRLLLLILLADGLHAALKIRAAGVERI